MPTLKITLPNSILSGTTSIGNISIFKIKQINSTMQYFSDIYAVQLQKKSTTAAVT